MTRTTEVLPGAAAWAVGLAVLAASAAAQTANPNALHGAAARPPAAQTASRNAATDMRLWSFGDCDRQFPYVSSDEHKECVRIVGSEEAKDARAYRVCDSSHEKDRTEAERCKSAYRTNKSAAAQNGLVPNAPAQPQGPVPPEVLERVRAIAVAAAEQDRAAAAEPAAADASAPQPATAAAAPAMAGVAEAAAIAEPKRAADPAPAGFWTPTSIVATLSALVLMAGLALKFAWRRSDSSSQY